MRFVVLIFLIFCAGFSALSQNESDHSGISLNVIVPDLGDDFRSNDESMLETRLQQIASNYGTGGAHFNPNIVLVPNVIVDDFETMGGAPPKTLARLDVVLKIANAGTKTIFTTTSLKTRGVGDNKKEAISEAIKKIDTRDDELASVIDKAKTKFVQYYNEQCDNMLRKAKANADAEKFSSAFSLLYRIPAEADCYDKAMDLVGNVFSQYQRVKCSKLLTAAEAAYGAGDMEEAAKNLALIPASSECSKEAEELADEMKDERIMKYKTEAEIEKLKVKSARDIAMAFAKNQPDKMVDIRFLTNE